MNRSTSSNAPKPIDVDDVTTWPCDVRAWVDSRATKLRGSTTYTNDLRMDDEDQLLAVVGSRLVRVCHCTRLLDREREVIRAQGLLPLSAELVDNRIRHAQENDEITEDERQAFASGHQFADLACHSRIRFTEGQVCFISSKQMFDRSPSNCEPLLSTWGGEAIYFPLKARHGERLRSLGRPSIVVATIDFSVAPADRHRCYPSLAKCMVGKRLRLEDSYGDVHYRAPVPAEHIEAIWQPGDREYDRYHKLPRS